MDSVYYRGAKLLLHLNRDDHVRPITSRKLCRPQSYLQCRSLRPNPCFYLGFFRGRDTRTFSKQRGRRRRQILRLPLRPLNPRVLPAIEEEEEESFQKYQIRMSLSERENALGNSFGETVAPTTTACNLIVEKVHNACRKRCSGEYDVYNRSDLVQGTDIPIFYSLTWFHGSVSGIADQSVFEVSEAIQTDMIPYL
ncbi:hypothetical protein EMCG_08985 [[Emmonsia] crescens]|uniref:Uncharacterized protein n=1 Tax=[Emmonsia] crescens TaxID=73230 RepID=A0A0G2I4J4_9EURO|nr:hypothetical protein EMCG_08985 [Emmonsia crescens UAMH 3008]